MADQSQISWGSNTAFSTLTNLHSLASTNYWNSGIITNTSPVEEILQISYNLVFNATPVAGDYLAFWIINSDADATTPYWPAQISESEGEISVAANKAEAAAALGNPHHLHFWQTSHTTTFRGLFNYFNPTDEWQLIILAEGEALASSGNVVRYRYGTPQVVSV